MNYIPSYFRLNELNNYYGDKRREQAASMGSRPEIPRQTTQNIYNILKSKCFETHTSTSQFTHTLISGYQNYGFICNDMVQFNGEGEEGFFFHVRKEF